MIPFDCETCGSPMEWRAWVEDPAGPDSGTIYICHGCGAHWYLSDLSDKWQKIT